MEKKDIKKAQGGFTLIEIIAVLVILGILAAVAVPRFLDLTDQAEQRAIEGAIAAGASNVTMQYSRMLLETASPPTRAALVTALNLEDNNLTNLGDFTATYAAAGEGADDCVNVDVAHDEDGYDGDKDVCGLTFGTGT